MQGAVEAVEKKPEVAVEPKLVGRQRMAILNLDAGEYAVDNALGVTLIALHEPAVWDEGNPPTGAIALDVRIEGTDCRRDPAPPQLGKTLAHAIERKPFESWEFRRNLLI